jgi:RNA ligase
MKNLEFLQILNQYKEEGKLYSQVHPSLPLIIWNYTPKVQYEGLWDDITLMCRGLVTDNSGKIWARPFEKFFNLEENRHEPTDDFEVFEKLDGSLIIGFWYNDEFILASRGSFTSDHVMKAKEILDSKRSKFEEHVTYLFELTGFQQIVVSYPVTDLTLIGTFDTETGNDIELLKDNQYWLGGLERVKKFNGLDWKNIKDLNWKNAEGFVVRFSNGSRCKIKFEDYIRLHRVMTNISEKKIWEALKDGKPISELLENVPDEFYDEVKRIETELLQKFYDQGDEYRNIFRGLTLALGPIPNRKDFAQIATKYRHPSILFAMLDGKDYSKIIWKMLEP